MLFKETALNILNSSSEDLAKETISTYYWNIKKVDDFSPGIACENIDETFVRNFRSHLIKQGNKPATIQKALSVLRIFTNKMFKARIIGENPFENIKIGRVYTRRGFLTTKELRSLYTNFLDKQNFLTRAEREAMKVFLFSCFTGLRYTDLKSLDAKDVCDYKIRKQMHKTGDAVYIPIPVQARALMPSKFPAGRIFHVTENSTFNRTLRKAAKKVGFTKHLHCHLARHTFATTCITLGIPLSATSKLLGHRNLDTTLIYAKYVDAYLDSEMRKFSKLK